MKHAPFDSGKDWSFPHLERAYSLLDQINSETLQLDCYRNQIEIISSEQMLDAYSYSGLPVGYPHWSYGKRFVEESGAYKRGDMGLAYEIVINSDPCIAYLMEENTMMMQTLVIAHACFGHNTVFKTNDAFRQWTDAASIIDYMEFAKRFVVQCEEKYGEQAVAGVLDAAHALQYVGIDRYQRPRDPSAKDLDERRTARAKYEEQMFDDIWRTLPQQDKKPENRPKFPSEPEDNILYFIEKHAPHMEEWKREILRIVRKTAQYFYPQMLTKVLNEGMATFTHYTMLHEMHARGHVTDGFMLEFFKSHSGVLHQPRFGSINPYTLGFAMLMDIKRMCLKPTKEDKTWFPDIAGSQDYLKVIKFAVANFKDDSFIQQFLSPKVIRDLRLFHTTNDQSLSYIRVNAIHDDEGYRAIRANLADQMNVNNTLPYMQIANVDRWGDRSMTIHWHSTHGRALHENDAYKTMAYMQRLWGYDIQLEVPEDPHQNCRMTEHIADKVFQAMGSADPKTNFYHL